MLLGVQSENAKVSTSVENKFVDQLPLVVAGAMHKDFAAELRGLRMLRDMPRGWMKA